MNYNIFGNKELPRLKELKVEIVSSQMISRKAFGLGLTSFGLTSEEERKSSFNFNLTKETLKSTL